MGKLRHLFISTATAAISLSTPAMAQGSESPIVCTETESYGLKLASEGLRGVDKALFSPEQLSSYQNTLERAAIKHFGEDGFVKVPEDGITSAWADMTGRYIFSVQGYSDPEMLGTAARQDVGCAMVIQGPNTFPR